MATSNCYVCVCKEKSMCVCIYSSVDNVTYTLKVYTDSKNCYSSQVHIIYSIIHDMCILYEHVYVLASCYM